MQQEIGVLPKGYVDSQIVIEFFDEFSLKIKKKTVVIIDNASIHTSEKFKNELKKWDAINSMVSIYQHTFQNYMTIYQVQLASISSIFVLKNLKSNLENMLNAVETKHQIAFA